MPRLQKSGKRSACGNCHGRGWVAGRNGFGVICAACLPGPLLDRAASKADPRRFTGEPPTGFDMLREFSAIDATAL
jgi:hypothetical protein